ncbi:MAG: hypothetical protein EAZ53_12665 [Bacteroidetes bacterium]|nr:MAG: hypothetical protein EAZ53_12665 [Bacteroidota bacterium]
MTCGYICPNCNGTGFDSELLADCDWCKPLQKPTISDEEWIKIVHEQNCCSDIGENNFVNENNK